MTEEHAESAEVEYKGFRASINLGKKEGAFVIFLVVVYFYLRLSGTNPTLHIVLGLVVGAWFAYRPSEWAVDGVESMSGHMRLTPYEAGILTSLASNMPEAVISGIAAFSGYLKSTPGNPHPLLNISVLSVLVAAGFNMLLLGSTIVISTRKEGEMKIPPETIKKDAVLIRWTVVALFFMFTLGIVEAVFSGNSGSFFFPWEAALLLFLSYMIYAVYMIGEKPDTTEIAETHHTRRTASMLWILGLIGIFFAGEVLTSSVDLLITQHEQQLSTLGDPVTIAALILGAAGALPEHGIAIVSALKGKIGIAVGNLVGGILQIVLLIMGGIGIFVPIPLSRYVLFQIIVIAGSLWFFKSAVTDDNELDTFEGMMIILLQVYMFVLLITAPAIGP